MSTRRPLRECVNETRLESIAVPSVSKALRSAAAASALRCAFVCSCEGPTPFPPAVPCPSQGVRSTTGSEAASLAEVIVARRRGSRSAVGARE